jgi:phosphoglycolate phosphatase
MYDTILFDLDGTLSASAEGITKSVQYALSAMGCPEPDLRKLEVFIGPPLTEQFMAYAGWGEEQARQASRYFRERYERKGIYENTPYPGVAELLAALQRAGRTLCVASSKPELFVRKILHRCGLDRYFTDMAGARLDETGSHKDEVIADALHRLGRWDRRDGVIMVGDRSHDVLGARQLGLPCVAVTYGYGSRAELEAARPQAFAASPAELETLLLDSGRHTR